MKTKMKSLMKTINSILIYATLKIFTKDCFSQYMKVVCLVMIAAVITKNNDNVYL